MNSDVTVSIPFVRVDASQNPNIRQQGDDSSAVYFRAMIVSFASVRRLHPHVRLELISNAEPPQMFSNALLALGVETKVISFDHRPPQGFTTVFEASLFLLDALDSLNSATTIMIDPDVLLIRPLDNMLRTLGGRVGAVPIDYSVDHNINGISRRQAAEIHQELGESASIPDHIGGEFYVFPYEHYAMLRERSAAAWDLALRRFRGNHARFTTEEHILSYAIRGVPFKDISCYVRRIWTAHRFRNARKDDASLTAWHLPAEKDRGFAEMYGPALDRRSWFWVASEAEFVAHASKIMGLNQRSPGRLALDAAGQTARWMSDIKSARSGKAKK